MGVKKNRFNMMVICTLIYNDTEENNDSFALCLSVSM